MKAIRKEKIPAHMLGLIGKACGNRYKEIMRAVPKQLEETLWGIETAALC
jgi:hypothetical protein